MTNPTLEGPPQAPPPPSEQEVAEKSPEQQNYEDLKNMFEEASNLIQSEGGSAEEIAAKISAKYESNINLSEHVTRHLAQYSGASENDRALLKKALTQRIQEEQTFNAVDIAAPPTSEENKPSTTKAAEKEQILSEPGQEALKDLKDFLGVKKIPLGERKDFIKKFLDRIKDESDEDEIDLVLLGFIKSATSRAKELASSSAESVITPQAPEKAKPSITKVAEEEDDSIRLSKEEEVAKKEMKKEVSPNLEWEEEIKRTINGYEQLIKETSSDEVRVGAENRIKELKEKLVEQAKQMINTYERMLRRRSDESDYDKSMRVFAEKRIKMAKEILAQEKPTPPPAETLKTGPAVDEPLKDFRTTEEGKPGTEFTESVDNAGQLELKEEEKKTEFAEFVDSVEELELAEDVKPTTEAAPPPAEPTYEQPKTTAELRDSLLPKFGNEKIKVDTEGMIYNTEQLIQQTDSPEIKALAEQLLAEEKEKLVKQAKEMINFYDQMVKKNPSESFRAFKEKNIKWAKEILAQEKEGESKSFMDEDIPEDEKPKSFMDETEDVKTFLDDESKTVDAEAQAEKPPQTTEELRKELLPGFRGEKLEVSSEKMIELVEQLINQTSTEEIKELAEQLLVEEKEKVAQEAKAAKEKQPKTTAELRKELLKGKPESLNDDEIFTIIKSYSQKYAKKVDKDPDLALLAKKLLREESGKRMRAKKKSKQKKKRKK